MILIIFGVKVSYLNRTHIPITLIKFPLNWDLPHYTLSLESTHKLFEDQLLGNRIKILHLNETNPNNPTIEEQHAISHQPGHRNCVWHIKCSSENARAQFWKITFPFITGWCGFFPLHWAFPEIMEFIHSPSSRLALPIMWGFRAFVLFVGSVGDKSSAFLIVSGLEKVALRSPMFHRRKKLPCWMVVFLWDRAFFSGNFIHDAKMDFYFGKYGQPPFGCERETCLVFALISSWILMIIWWVTTIQKYLYRIIVVKF